MNVLGSRIRIRPTRQQDLKFLQRLWNDGAVMRYRGYPDGMHVTEAGMQRWWEMTPQAQHPSASLSPLMTPHCVIELLDGTLIGELSYTLDAHQRATIDLKITADRWNQGYATEVLELALREIFATTPAIKIVVEPPAAHTAARKLCLQCGFHPAPTENHPDRWECTRGDFAHRADTHIAEVA